MDLALSLVLLFAICLIGAPIGLNIHGSPLGALPATFMVGTGIFLALTVVVLFTITKLYHKTKASEAFVRTGMGGLKVVRDGGAIVLPVIHQVVKVSLATIRLEVERKGAEALLTFDKLRADIKAEFFVRVQPIDESIQSAARSLGDKMTEETEVRRGDRTQSAVSLLIEDKLVSALRTSAARKTLEQLNSDRDEFLKEVISMVTGDLAHNGFTLESVTISKLDQTDVQFLKTDNVFDAQGARTIAEITQSNLTKRNEIVRNGELARTSQDVVTRQQVLELERTRAEAEATQKTQVATVTAEQDRIAKERQIEAIRSVEVAQVEQNKSIQVAKQGQERDVAVAEQERLKAITIATQGVEVAKRAQEQAIAVAESERALAEAKLAESEAKRQEARQAVLTVEQVAAAEREKQKQVIQASALAEQSYVKDSKAADASAYRVKAEADARMASADADANAMKKKADAEAISVTRRAEGDKFAAMAKAEGDQATLVAQAAGQKAISMVPVEVQAEQVKVEQSRVETVLKPELEAREKSGRVAQDFELAQIRITAEKEVRIESARALATIQGKITANVYGTPEDVARMNAAFAQGMGLSSMLGGFLDGTNNNPDATAALGKAVGMAGQIINRLTGDAPTDKT
jgi:flotillin